MPFRWRGMAMIDRQEGLKGPSVRIVPILVRLIGRQEGLQGPSVRIVPILVRYRVSFSKLPQLQFWHLYRSVFAQSMAGLCARVPYAFHFASNTDVDLSSKLNSVRVTSTWTVQCSLQYCKHRGLDCSTCCSILHVSILWPSIPTGSCCALCSWSTPNSALYVRNNGLEFFFCVLLTVNLGIFLVTDQINVQILVL